MDHNSLWNTEELHWNQRKDLGPNTLMLMATKEVDLGSNTLVAIFQNLGSNTLMAIKEADFMDCFVHCPHDAEKARIVQQKTECYIIVSLVEICLYDFECVIRS